MTAFAFVAAPPAEKQQRQDLNGLAQAHVISQARAEAQLSQNATRPRPAADTVVTCPAVPPGIDPVQGSRLAELRQICASPRWLNMIEVLLRSAPARRSTEARPAAACPLLLLDERNLVPSLSCVCSASQCVERVPRWRDPPLHPLALEQYQGLFTGQQQSSNSLLLQGLDSAQEPSRTLRPSMASTLNIEGVRAPISSMTPGAGAVFPTRPAAGARIRHSPPALETQPPAATDARPADQALDRRPPSDSTSFCTHAQRSGRPVVQERRARQALDDPAPPRTV